MSHKQIAELIPKTFGSVNPPLKFVKHISVRQTEGFGNPLISMITETDEIQKQFCLVIAEQELPKLTQQKSSAR